MVARVNEALATKVLISAVVRSGHAADPPQPLELAEQRPLQQATVREHIRGITRGTRDVWAGPGQVVDVSPRSQP
jgi:hypothetical protein